jgi:hypothetical protein
VVSFTSTSLRNFQPHQAVTEQIKTGMAIPITLSKTKEKGRDNMRRDDWSGTEDIHDDSDDDGLDGAANLVEFSSATTGNAQDDDDGDDVADDDKNDVRDDGVEVLQHRE